MSSFFCHARRAFFSASSRFGRAHPYLAMFMLTVGLVGFLAYSLKEKAKSEPENFYTMW
ncbi:hypothetical protein [Paraburkholderia bannensis]|uniref:hypothetical protein n=1 Tax=Paraburkholderia bannensis TaxID=765414 RepID=UPI002AAFD690|nr:hypothetical protein [Paraburkholderia bannensis]